MNLVSIQPDVLINPDKVSVIQKKVIRNKARVEIVIDGRSYFIADEFVEQAMNELMKAGVEINPQFWSL